MDICTLYEQNDHEYVITTVLKAFYLTRGTMVPVFLLIEHIPEENLYNACPNYLQNILTENLTATLKYIIFLWRILKRTVLNVSGTLALESTISTGATYLESTHNANFLISQPIPLM